MHPEILQQREKLRHLFKQAKHLQKNDDIDDETKSGFVSYLCVRTSGYVEFAVKMILRKYVESKTDDKPTVNFAHSQLKRLTPNRDNILGLVGQFDEEWKKSLGNSITVVDLDGTVVDLGGSLGSIVKNRHDIAHGVDVDLSLADLEKHFIAAQEVVELVYSECS